MAYHKHWEKKANGWEINSEYDCEANHCYIPNYVTKRQKRNLKTEIENRVFGTDIFTMKIEKENELTKMLDSFGVKRQRITDIKLNSLSLRPRAHRDAIRGLRAVEIFKKSEETYNKKLRKYVEKAIEDYETREFMRLSI